MPEIKNYGMTTMGERGQVVIPKKVREKMNLNPGDKFLVFSKADMVVAFIKPDNFDKLLAEYIDQFKNLKKIKK